MSQCLTRLSSRATKCGMWKHGQLQQHQVAVSAQSKEIRMSCLFLGEESHCLFPTLYLLEQC
jgi:hypothetical protein